MTGCYGNSKEDKYFESMLNKELAKYDDPVADLAEEMKANILNDDAAFQTIEDDYEVVKRNHNQIMRMLRALPGACSGNQVDLDAITSALSVIERDLDNAIEDEAANSEYMRKEMFWGGEE